MTYFKPFGRKLGVVTLVIACVVAAGWVTSFFSISGLEFPGANSRHQILSDRGRLLWISQALTSEEYQEYLENWDEWPRIQLFVSLPQVDYLRGWELRWMFSGCDQYARLRQELEDRCTRIPYGMLVIPLTMLSAYLLLSKSPQNLVKVPA